MNICIQQDIKRQIQRKKDDGGHEVFQVNFNKTLVVEKKIQIKTTYSDICYSHIFKRPTLNYSISYSDENVDHKTKDYITMRLFSGLNKKNNDRIHPTLYGNTISLSVHGDLLLPGEGLTIIALRVGCIA